MSITPTCSTCLHWRPPAEGAQGGCHRRSPQPMLTLATLTTHPRWLAIWPETLAGETCGEHQPVPCRPTPSRADLLRGLATSVAALLPDAPPCPDDPLVTQYRAGWVACRAGVAGVLRDEAARVEGTPP